MPKHKVTKAFHYATGGEVLRIKKGEQELAPDVLAHAIKHGFVASEATKKPAAQPEAEPDMAEQKPTKR